MATASVTLTDNPFYIEASAGDTPISYDAEDFRRVNGAIWPRTGILTPGSFKMSQSATVGWSFQVAPGYAVLGNTATQTSRYLVQLQSAANVVLTGFNTSPTGTRTHRVFLCIYDKLISGTEYNAKILVTEDTTGAGAPDPTGVSYFIQLGIVVIGVNQNYITGTQIANQVRHGGMGYSHVALTPSGGIVDASSDITVRPLAVKYFDGRCYLRGAVKRNTGNPFEAGGNFNLFVLPDYYRPDYTQYLSAVGSLSSTGYQSDNTAAAMTALTAKFNAAAVGGSSTGAALALAMATVLNTMTFNYRVTVNTNGLVQADLPILYAPQYLMVDGLSYELD